METPPHSHCRRYEGRVAIVSGAAGSLGSAIARRLAVEGAEVLIADQMHDGARRVAESIGTNARAYHLDAADEASIAGMVQAAIDAFGRLDVVVNNVADTALTARDRTVLDISSELWDRAFQINARSYFLATKYALPHLLAKGGGAFVHTASAAGLAGDVGLTAYGASKAAVVNFSRSVAAQFGRKGIRSNTVCPGMIATDPPHPEDMAALYQAGLASAYATRNGLPRDIAAMVAYLAADEAGFVNGGTFTCDGGQMAVVPPWRPAGWQ
jgi:NAD(P)-dependent dehydrogenase (short-subunit alcohol dehydrogenase family)